MFGDDTWIQGTEMFGVSSMDFFFSFFLTRLISLNTYVCDVRTIFPTWVSLFFKEKGFFYFFFFSFLLKKTMGNKKYIFCVWLFFFFLKTSSSPSCPRRKISPFKGLSEAFPGNHCSWQWITGQIPCRRLIGLPADTEIAVAAASLPEWVWAAPFPKTSAWIWNLINKAESTL